MKIRELARTLVDAGFVVKRRGSTSHAQYAHPGSPGRVVPLQLKHMNDDASHRVVRSVLAAIERARQP